MQHREQPQQKLSNKLRDPLCRSPTLHKQRHEVAGIIARINMTESSPKPGDNNETQEEAGGQSRPSSEVVAPDEAPSAATQSSPTKRTTNESTAAAITGSDGAGTDEESEATVEQSSSDDGEEGEGDDDEEDEEEEEEEDEEPKLKYARLTQHLGPVYRNGDATSSFLVAGDKTIIGTHNGNIHVIQLPVFQPLRVYHAHSASVTAVSISPYPPPLSATKHESAHKSVSVPNSPRRPGTATGESHTSAAAASRRPREQQNAVPNTPSNNIYIATSSMDGNVCVQSLVDIKDVSLRNFARPVQSVALSPEFRTDRTYLSGGLSGQLILTAGAPTGRSTATTTGAAAQAAGWLGGMVGASSGKDTVLHSGEGTINTIKWSLSGRYVVWLNEHGIKIMRTKLHLDHADADDAWKRIGHIDRPQTEQWDTMASVWKGRAEWIDEQAIESDDPEKEQQEALLSPAAERLKQQQLKHSQTIERLLVGWGGTIWIIHVHPGGVGVGKNAGERSAGRAEIVKILRMDCIISGISLYTQNMVLVLAFCLPDDDDEDEEEGAVVRGHKHTASTTSTGSEPSGGIRRRVNNSPPELRLIDLTSQAEVDKDSLTLSRFERLSSNDYHLGVLPAQTVAATASTRGALETLAGLGTGMLNAALNPAGIFSSAASVRSKDSDDRTSSSKVVPATGVARPKSVHPNLSKPGVKIFIHSPYDCILATRRDLGDHLQWLLDHQEYQKAWELVDEHPEVASATAELAPLSPQQTHSTDDFYDDNASVIDGMRNFFSSAEKEKRRIGELWLQELVEAGDWTKAGRVAGQVLGTPDRWEKWVWTFAGAHKFDEIVNYIPVERTRPPIPGTIYEVVLGHYLQTSKPQFRDLLERWSPDLFEITTITTALEDQLNYRDVREDSVEDGEVGRDWRIVVESLAKLHEANGRTREALKCYIKLQDADSAMRLIKDGHLADAVADDIPSFIGLRVPQDQLKKMTPEELEKATLEAITLLVDEAQHGLVKPDIVVNQLQEKGLDLYTFFYLRGLWRGEGIHEHSGESRARLVTDSQSLVDNFADLAVHLFAVYNHDRSLFMDFLKTSTAYAFEKAVQECEKLNYIPELVYLYSKTGQMKRALYLIIDRLGDVSRAIAFAKEQDDPDLWEDLLEYSMDKPRFIRGLLEEVGTAINPITLVRRIPEGLEIDGLREGLKHIMKEHEIQHSISSGVAKVLRSEVGAAQNLLRSGQKKGVKFEIAVKKKGKHVDVQVKDVPTMVGTGGEKTIAEDNGYLPHHNGDSNEASKPPGAGKKWSPGHCAECFEAFTEWEMETLVGFACGHVFHLTHLLEKLHPGKPVDEALLNGFGGEQRPHLIGAKVNHARLLRDQISAGCPVCLSEETEQRY
ncbi:putative vacuolar protein sorting-associated protein [Podospora australis]|uniref:Vacuolar protein sorting-associated protein n=1 Tax=Podospora australis TaxID=1536484 RepID=A0AAN6WW71_9PEZI|nr:putative vacuolar protein sorting-associated protein [Podospora australis]